MTSRTELEMARHLKNIDYSLQELTKIMKAMNSNLYELVTELKESKDA